MNDSGIQHDIADITRDIFNPLTEISYLLLLSKIFSEWEIGQAGVTPLIGRPIGEFRSGVPSGSLT